MNLTFILDPRVPDLQDPVLAARLVQGGEPVIRGVAVHARAQEVRVMMSDPGDLNKSYIKPVGTLIFNAL